MHDVGLPSGLVISPWHRAK